MSELDGTDEARRCRIQLVRHGQTVMNVEHRFRGLLDIPLSEVGRAEAWNAARRLAGIGVSAVYTSPLGRAREVAHAICSATGIAAADDLGDLLNLDYGRWEGLTREECAEADPDEWECYALDPERAACPGGESLGSAADRVVNALRTIGRRHPGETVAAVSHGVMLRLAVLRVAGPFEGDWQFDLPTGSAIAFEVEGDRVSLASPLDRSIAKKEPLTAALDRTG
jgi:broad specificity phosphatase PhoE